MIKISFMEREVTNNSVGGILLPQTVKPHVEKLIKRQELIEKISQVCAEFAQTNPGESLQIQLPAPVLRNHTVLYDSNKESRNSGYFTGAEFITGEERCVGYLGNPVRDFLESSESFQEVIDEINEVVVYLIKNKLPKTEGNTKSWQISAKKK